MEEVNYVKHLNGVFRQFARDSRLNPTHISLYMALFQLWNINYFQAVIFINRQEMMELAKIGSKSTYHRCIKELDHYDYIQYMPSNNHFHGSRVRLAIFGTRDGQEMNPSSTKSGTGGGQEVGHIYKHKQTGKSKKNNNKPENFENGFFYASEKKKNKDSMGVGQNRDNLKTTTDKDYGEPL